MIDIQSRQFSIPSISYRFWANKTKQMLDVARIEYIDGMPKYIFVYDTNKDGEQMVAKLEEGENEDGRLIPSTGYIASSQMNNIGEELFYGDLVWCGFLNIKDKLRMIFWENGWRVFGASTQEFKDNLDTVLRLGNRWKNPELYEQYLGIINNEDGRQEEAEKKKV